jgi:hypothetical protein
LMTANESEIIAISKLSIIIVKKSEVITKRI